MFLFVCHCNSEWAWNKLEMPEVISELEWPVTGWPPQIWGKEVKSLPQSTTAPLTSRWVHCGEGQDAPVVGIERIRCTPWSKATIREKFGSPRPVF